MNPFCLSILLALPLRAFAADAPPAGSANVAVDTEAEAAYARTQSAFVDLDKSLAPAPAAEVALGKELFFDPRLSTDKTMSCASCHIPSLAWSDGLPRARGLNRGELSRNTPSLFNVNRNIAHLFFWDGRAATLEEAAQTALESRLEMNRDPRALAVELERVPGYVRAFADVYGDQGITPQGIIKAISAFVRTIQPGETPFDRFGRDPRALSPEAREGLILFAGKARCMQCHNGPYFSDDFFHNIGLNPTPGVDDPGRYAVTHERRSWRAFRTQPLRNVALTAPYMHDGSLATLHDVVDFYNRGGDNAEGRDVQIRPLGLSPQEVDDLVAFLESLTSPQTPVTLPVLPPSEVPASWSDAMALEQERLRMLKAALRRGDRDALFIAATALREGSVAARPLLAPLSPGSQETDCLADVDRRAWELSELAESTAPAADLGRSLDDVDYALSRCSSAADGTHASIASPTDIQAASSCLPDFSMARLTRSLAAGEFSARTAARIREATIKDALFYYEFKAILDGDPGACDQLKGFQKSYAGIVRKGDAACRERFYEDMMDHDIITRSPRFLEHCTQSLIHSYDYLNMDAATATDACSILKDHMDDPAEACRRLVPRYLKELKLESCENILRRLRPHADRKECDELSGQPGDWMGRCLSLTAFNEAYWKKDESLCGASELCRAFMGDAPRSVAPSSARVRNMVCQLLRQAD